MSEWDMLLQQVGRCFSDLPRHISNLVFDTYGADRHLEVLGAVAPLRRGRWGLVAGCALAKDILKAFLAEPLRQCPTNQLRDYVDDITLQIDAGDPGPCAAQMEASLGDFMTALEADNMVLNAAKQQVLGLTKAVRDAWEARGRTAAAVAKDLCISHYGYGTTHPELSRKTKSLRVQAQPVCIMSLRADVYSSVCAGSCARRWATRRVDARVGPGGRPG